VHATGALAMQSVTHLDDVTHPQQQVLPHTEPLTMHSVTRLDGATCTNAGPWVQADLEKGLWSGNTTNTQEPVIIAKFVTAMVKGKPGGWALKGGDAQLGLLTTFYEGGRPSDKSAGHSLPGGGNYDPMRKEGHCACSLYHGFCHSLPGGGNYDPMRNKKEGHSACSLYHGFCHRTLNPATLHILESRLSPGYRVQCSFLNRMCFATPPN
jgi:hypothetical protein